ncbi:ATP-binding protein [Bordetella petrii]|uniref:PAS domain-containing hybrid sensor histidine kinase/response regulator n=1 Tax=Bordetella petrii TaxID=94624 RepID=UPI00372E7E74
MASPAQAAWTVILALFVPIALATVLALLLDRSKRRREHAALQTHAFEIQHAIDSITQAMPVALFHLRRDAQGRQFFPYVTGRTEAFIGPRAEEIMANGARWHERVFGDDRPAIDQAIERSTANSSPILIDVRIRRDEGAGWVRLGTGRPEQNADGSVGWKGYWVDVTAEHEQARALAQAKSEAEASAAAKARFLAAMSHEIRTPLATLIGALDLLRDTALAPFQRSQFEQADNAARLLMEIIGDILDFSRLEAGNAKPESVPFQLSVLLEEVLRVFDAQVRRKQLELSLDIDSRVAPWLLGDPVRIKQIALNLVGNAVKFTARGSIEVSVRPGSPANGGQQWIVLSVSDTGVGIAESAQSQLFQPFTQADVSIARQYGGSGLGLAVCRQLAELLGGTIRFNSTLGRGSTFEVRLPFTVAAMPAGKAARPPGPITATMLPEPPGQAAAARRRILMVDDHEPYRIILRQLAAKAGFECDAAAGGAQALAALADQSYAMLFTDLHMAGMDGCELAHRVRAREANSGRRLPIIMLTAHLGADEMQRCRDADIDDYLTKPVTAAALRRCIEKWIN